MRKVIEALRQSDAEAAQALCRDNRLLNLQTQVEALQRYRILDV
ncbi:hypothetical protein QCE62_24955 [Caballeronia sp. LZ033]|nr:hypothetical protein [Caballeronia sp. LZ033]MDR5816851.1 hypothetical protein [Caballeronia sp. LZ033]